MLAWKIRHCYFGDLEFVFVFKRVWIRSIWTFPMGHRPESFSQISPLLKQNFSPAKTEEKTDILESLWFRESKTLCLIYRGHLPITVLQSQIYSLILFTFLFLPNLTLRLPLGIKSWTSVKLLSLSNKKQKKPSFWLDFNQIRRLRYLRPLT